jgi:phenylpropionate dioxygenase-like ring-hydroxylating dioxygenase large terminal subunit
MAYDMHADLAGVARRALANVDGRTTDMSDMVWHEPVVRYADQARHEREIDVLFHRTPQLLGLSCDWPENGSFRTFDLIPGRPVLIARGADGVLRAFLNVCRHRGARVVHETEGTEARFRCPFHAWTYRNDGSLAAVPFPEAFPDLDKCTSGLTEVGCREWHGMVWVVATAGVTPDVDAFLGELAPLLAMYEFERAQRFVAHHLEATNWKLAVDTYLEGYHFASLHPNTINLINYDNSMVFDAYGPHSRQGFPRRNLLELSEIADDDWEVHRHLTCVHQLFPNIALTVSPEGILINAVYPGNRFDQSTTVQTHYTRTPITDDAERAVMEQRSNLVRDVVRTEDYWMTASIQAGITSGAQDTVVFGRNEQALHHYHRALVNAVPDVARRSGSNAMT